MDKSELGFTVLCVLPFIPRHAKSDPEMRDSFPWWNSSPGEGAAGAWGRVPVCFFLPLGISNGGWAGEERRPTNPEAWGGGVVGEKDLPSQPLQLSSWPLGYSCRAVGRAEVGRARSPLPVEPQDCTHCLLLQRLGCGSLEPLVR